MLAVIVTSTAVDDDAAAAGVLGQRNGAKFPRLKVIWANSKYHNYKHQEWIDNDFDRTWRLEVKIHPADVKVSCFYLNAGWWNGPTLGSDATGGIAATMSVSRPQALL